MWYKSLDILTPDVMQLWRGSCWFMLKLISDCSLISTSMTATFWDLEGSPASGVSSALPVPSDWRPVRAVPPLQLLERREWSQNYEWGWSDESFYRRTGGLLDFYKAVYVTAEQTALLQQRRSPCEASDISPRSSITPPLKWHAVKWRLLSLVFSSG